nr:xylulose kinase-1 [Tanacetum cinerariifolium]
MIVLIFEVRERLVLFEKVIDDDFEFSMADSCDPHTCWYTCEVDLCSPDQGGSFFTGHGGAFDDQLTNLSPNSCILPDVLFLNGNSKKSLGRDSKGGIIILPPVSFEEHVVQRETKARTFLLQSLPEDHMADLYYLDDVKEIWLAVKARFGGNEESKKMRKTMLKQKFSEFSASEEEGLHKGYDRALPPS